MRRIHLVLASGLLLALPGHCLTQPERAISDIKKDMTAEEVEAALGNPDRVARQILFRRYLEQWTYSKWATIVELNCLPGEPPRVVNIIPSSTP